jgi:hypothetical protein
MEPAHHYSGEYGDESLQEAPSAVWPLRFRLCQKTENNNILWTSLLKIEQVESAAMGGEVLRIRCPGSQPSWNAIHCRMLAPAFTSVIRELAMCGGVPKSTGVAEPFRM